MQAVSVAVAVVLNFVYGFSRFQHKLLEDHVVLFAFWAFATLMLFPLFVLIHVKGKQLVKQQNAARTLVQAAGKKTALAGQTIWNMSVPSVFRSHLEQKKMEKWKRRAAHDVVVKAQASTPQSKGSSEMLGMAELNRHEFANSSRGKDATALQKKKNVSHFCCAFLLFFHVVIVSDHSRRG